MIISLAASMSLDNDLEANLTSMEKMLAKAKADSSELVLFGEAFLQGFDALTFNYDYDINNVALGLHSPEITKIRHLARKYDIGIGFGFFENDHSGIFDSYLIVNAAGETVAKYQRISAGGWIPEANAEYRMGREFPVFTFGGKRFTIMVCGDFWTDDLLCKIVELDPQVDAFLWPVHCDYTSKEWNDSAGEDYRKQSQILAKPIFFVNNVRPDEDGAKGGAFVWQQGRELAAHEPGQEGILTYKWQ
ncbi:MAG: carbon-nitrogen hydrolase family protein [Eubacteriales bacterium]|nr:carbon-nitrogen hydrolase family protein [Eubacteriales bacterium]MDD4541042.1 carbon-nitrogen hydrolase family protein [Eubacteriales bacterium]